MSTDNKTDEKTYVVYCHTAPNGVYYGVTCNTKSRWIPSNYTKSNTPFKDAIERFGWKNIKHEVLYSCLTRDEALRIEGELIVNGWNNGTCLNVNHSGHYQQTEGFKDDMRVYRRTWKEKDPEGYKIYQREWMREYRKRKKGGGDKPEPLF